MRHTELEPEQKIFKTLKGDLRAGGFRKSIRAEFRELKEFMLNEQGKKRLSEMGWWRRWFFTAWWLLKSLFFKLTPVRRIVFTVGIFFLVIARSITVSSDQVQFRGDTQGIGVVCVLFVLLLELKDKLIAREELEAGRAVQQALMPETTPQIAGWNIWLFSRSANEVGGDLVDCVEVGEGKLGIVLGDVAGKGLRAALLMAKLQATVRAVAPDYSDLSELAAKLNGVFYRDSLKNMFASALYIEVTPNTDQIRLVNAGHLPPLIVHGKGYEVHLKGGPALGLMQAATYQEQQLSVKPGEIICLYSDGVTEAQNTSGVFFDVHRVGDFLEQSVDLPVHRIGSMIVAEIDRFIGEARCRDDVSLALIKRV